MALLTSFQIALILIAIASYILYMKWVRSKYPHGPWPLPIIGNLHLLSKKPYIELTEMSKTYGPVFTIWIGWEPTVVVSGLHHMKEALIQKGFEFAGRAMDTPGYRILSYGNEAMSCRSYDEKVSIMRKLALSIMKETSMGGVSIRKVVERNMDHLVQILKEIDGKLVDPSTFVHLPVANTIMQAVLNTRFENKDDLEFVKWTEANVALWRAVEKATLLNLVPVLSYILPGVEKGILSQLQPYTDFVEKHVKYHEETYKEGTIRDFADIIIQYQNSQGHEIPLPQQITRVNLCELVKDMLVGGSETTFATVLWSFLVLLYRKDIQQKIHFEIDQYLERRKQDLLQDLSSKSQHEDHCSSPLLFTLADKPNLPYLNAFIHETMRLWPIAPFPLPHRTMVNTSIGNDAIPEHTTILFNIYGCHRDDAIWEKPLDCIPERFLDDNGQFDQSKANQLMSFGAGPRTCVGRNLARMEIFVCLANVLHAFELCCPSVDKLPALNDGLYQMELFPYTFQMVFKIRQES